MRFHKHLSLDLMAHCIAAQNAAVAQESQKVPTWVPEKHNIVELYWVGLRKWLEEKGYMLRPRYREGWVASWMGTGKAFYTCEDGQVHRVSHCSMSDDSLEANFDDRKQT